MKDTKSNKKVYIQAFSALIVLGLLVYGILWVLGGGLSRHKSVRQIPVHSTSTAPAVVQHFLLNAGNIGNLSDTSFGAISQLSKTYNENLVQAYKNSVTDFADTSPYVVNSTLTPQDLKDNGNSETPAAIYVLNKNNIRMGKINKINNITAIDKYNSSHTEQAVTINVDFSNTVYNFAPTANDTSWDGSYNASKQTNEFDNIKFTLVYEGGRWKIYSIAEQDDIGPNFATYDNAFEHSHAYKFTTNTEKVKIKKGGDLNEIINK